MKVPIIVITPSVRPEMLEIVERCLKRQTSKNFLWCVVGNQEVYNKYPGSILEPPKKEGDYYNLDKAWNAAFKHVEKRFSPELIVIICDGQWFEPDLLERLWNHYLENPKAIVGAVGNQYNQIINGKPEHMVWQDPRKRTDMGSFYETLPTEIEWCIVSIPKQAIFDIGGLDEKYDQGAALGEKEANLRMEKAGYKMYLDQSIEYRAIHHPRLSTEWDERYKIASEMYSKDIKDILAGKKLNLDYLN